MAYPEEDAQLLFETIMIAAAFLLGSIVTLLITAPTVLDSDPSSYIIITLLMSFLFIFFTMKNRSSLAKGNYDLVSALVILLVYVLMVAVTRSSLSFEFLTFRLDAMLLPLMLLAIVVAISDMKGATRFAPVLAYLLFASPVILLPIIGLNGNLAYFSAGIVYSVLKIAGVHALQSGLSIIAPSGSIVQIASTCVPIGTFIAFVMLLIPVVYLYSGKILNKLSWLISGVALLFLLNILRMIIISIAWATSGIGGAVATFHAFGGTLIFYLSIIVMLLLYNQFGLSLNFGKKWSKRIRAAFSAYDIEADYSRIAVAVIIGLVALFLSLGYLHSYNARATLFNSTIPMSNSSRLYLYTQVFNKLNASHISYAFLGSGSNGVMVMELGNNSDATNATYMVVSFYPFVERGGNTLNYTSTSSKSTLMLNDGITVTSLIANSSNVHFYINYFAIPMKVGNSYVSANFEIFSRANLPGANYCNTANYSGVTTYFESAMYNIATGRPIQPQPILCYSAELAS